MKGSFVLSPHDILLEAEHNDFAKQDLMLPSFVVCTFNPVVIEELTPQILISK